MADDDKPGALRWGIVGVGIAGAARARAIAADPRAVAVCGHGGRPASAGLPEAGSFEALLDQVDAVAVCSPDTAHPEQVEAALRAGRHVLCEFPLAGSARKARQLFQLAEQVGRVLHVEHIELLTPEARWLRAHAAPMRLITGAVRHQGPARARVFSVAHANVARLHRLVDAVGLPRRVHILDASPERLHAELRFHGDVKVELDLRQEAGAARRQELILQLDHGTVMVVGRSLLYKGAPVALPEGPGLFAADQLAATAEILDGALPYVTSQRVVEVLELADRIDTLARQHQEALRRPAGA
jgi:biliverdin reductase